MPIPNLTRSALAADPFMRVCIHRFLYAPTPCEGRVEWEHALVYAGKQVQEPWAIVPVCTRHHRGPGLIKQYNVLFALLRAPEDRLRALSKARSLIQERDFLLTRFALDDELMPVPKAPLCPPK